MSSILTKCQKTKELHLGFHFPISSSTDKAFVTIYLALDTKPLYQCYIPSFVEMGHLVLGSGEEDF